MMMICTEVICQAFVLLKIGGPRCVTYFTEGGGPEMCDKV